MWEARLGARGFGDSDVFWEEEQERLLVALDPLLREKRARLVFPDEGSRETLRRELERRDRPRVLHLSCHGGTGAGGEGVVFLEDEEGRRAPTAAAEVLRWISAVPQAPRLDLVMLSACYTAASHPGGHPGERARSLISAPAGTAEASLAEALVAGGVPRVLGMQTGVSVPGATAFAEAFYEQIAEGSDLPLALRAGRSALGWKGAPHEWAVPVLLVASDTGPLVAPREAQSAPVAGLEEREREVFRIGEENYLGEGYAGRRDFERRLARAFPADRPVVVHGLGGLGKSTLAARFLLRRKAAGARVWVVALEENLPAAVLRERVLDELEVERPGGLPPEEAERVTGERVEAKLREAASFLLLDNFEVVQGEDGAFRDPAVGEFLEDLIEKGREGFGLLVTSRLALPGARNLDLAELPPSAARKMKLRREGLRGLGEAEWEAVMEHVGGHPKALEILGGYLSNHPERVARLVERFGPVSEAVETELGWTRQKRGRALLVETVLKAVPEERRASFDRLALLAAPLPTGEIVALLEGEGVREAVEDLGWLRARGLLAGTVAGWVGEGGELVHRLLANCWQGALKEREGAEAERVWHRRVAEQLVRPGRPLSNYGLAAHHLDCAGDRVGALERYAQWAVALWDRMAYRASEQVAEEGLRRFPAGREEETRTAAAVLWLRVFEALLVLGELKPAEGTLDRAEELLHGIEDTRAAYLTAGIALSRGRIFEVRGELEKAAEVFARARNGFEAGGSERDRAIALGNLARLFAQAGDVAEAKRLHEERLAVFERLRDVQSRAVALGDLARLFAQAGDVAEAKRLHEERLAVFERLRDVRSRAVALGDLARLFTQAGDLTQAKSLHREQLQVFEQLGDVRSRAVALGDLARLHTQAGDVAEAKRLFEEELQVFERLGDVRSRAVTLGDLARLLAQAGEIDEARRLFKEKLEIVERLGDARSRAVALGDLARLHTQAGDVAEAKRLHQERLTIFERLGDVRERAMALGDLARFFAQAGDIGEARRLLEEELQVFERLGDVQSRAVTLGDLARLFAQAGDVADAKRLHQERLAVFERLGDVRSRAATLRELARLFAQAGDVPEAKRLLEEGLQVFERLRDVRERAVTLGDLAQLLAKAGDVAQAKRLLEENLQVFERLGDVRERAVTQGYLARLLAKAGDVAQAKRLLEENLQVFERLGDVRERAVTLAYLARFFAKAGDVAQAKRLHRERLTIFERLGDMRERAVALSDFAQLLAQAGEIQEARRLQKETLGISRRLGDLEGVANTQFRLAQLDLKAGHPAAAHPRLAESWAIVCKINHAEAMVSTGETWGSLLASAGRTEEAFRVLALAEAAARRLVWGKKVDELAALRSKLPADVAGGGRGAESA